MATPADFNAKRYLELNPDLVAAYGWDENQATNHWNNWGQMENRNYGQAGWTGTTDPHAYWANSGLPAAEIDRRINLGYAHPETYNDYGPGSASWNQDRGVAPSSPDWQDYINRTQASGRAKAAEQAAADDGGMFGDLGPLLSLAALGFGGYGLLSGLGGLGAGAGAGLAEGFGGAGILGDSAMWGLGETAAAGAAGSGAMDWSNLGDLWDYGGGESLVDPSFIDTLGEWGSGGSGGQLMPYGQSMATAEELAAMQAKYPDWYNALTGVTDGGSSFGRIGNTLSSLLGGSGTSGVGGLFGGSGTSGGIDWMKLLGGLGAAGLGAYASNKQTNALEDMAGRYEGYGAPYRQKLSDLYANPDSFLNSNEVRKPVQQGTDMLMRSLSMQGNPFGSGNALQQGQNYASDQLFSKLGQEKDRLAGFGGLANYNAAAPGAATNAIGSSGNTYNAIGSGLGNIFNPPQTAAQTMADFMKAMKG